MRWPLSETKKYEGLIAGPAVAVVVRAEIAVPQMQGEYCGAATGYVRFTLNSRHLEKGRPCPLSAKERHQLDHDPSAQAAGIVN